MLSELLPTIPLRAALLLLAVTHWCAYLIGAIVEQRRTRKQRETVLSLIREAGVREEA